MRSLTTLLARLTTYFLYRRLEIEGRHLIPSGRPTLIVANHFNGLLDPVLLAAAIGRTPRFLAKSTLANVLGVGPLLRAFGVIFVQRRQDLSERDGAGMSKNADAFAECYAALRDRDIVAIFPEGTTHDRPRLDPVRTGAARIALGARAAGARDLVILPVGLTFTDKVALRGDALVQIGEPINLDRQVPSDATDEDVEAVRALTAQIDGRLRAVSPDFPDVESWLALDQAAEVAMRRPDRPTPPLALRAATARRLVAAPPEEQEAVRRQIGRYATVLAGLRITDRDVITPVNLPYLISRAVRTALLVVLLGSLVGATILVNAIPVAMVLAASMQVRRPVTKGTVRAVVGLVAFPATWITAGALTVDGAGPITLFALLMLAGALASIALLDRTLRLASAVLRWRLARERRATLADAAELRKEVVDTIYDALRTSP